MGNFRESCRAIKIGWILTGVLLLSGCDNNEQLNDSAEAVATTAAIRIEPTNVTPSILPAIDPQLLEIDAYWLAFAPQIFGKISIGQEMDEKPLRYYEEGLHNKDPLIRWYCTYRITDYADQLTESDHRIMNSLLEDPDPDVQKAAVFAKALLEATFTGDAFEHSANGEIVAYYKYQEARYNDGKVFLVRASETKIITLSPSITNLTISPNNRFLLIENGGRISTGAQVTDLSADTVVKLPNLVMDIIRDPKNGYDTEIEPAQIARFDDWVHFKEWSPEGNRFLYSYQFMDGKSVPHAGFAVLDLLKGEITKVYPREPNQDALANFSWETK